MKKLQDTAADDRDGATLVSGMAARCEWWRLRAADVAPWLMSLPGQPDPRGGKAVIGEGWCDGAKVGGAEAPDVDELLERLRREIGFLGRIGVALPGKGDVRVCSVDRHGVNQKVVPRRALVVDFDLGDFLLPIAVDEEQLRSSSPSIDRIVHGMVGIVTHAAKHRPRVAARERSFRDAASSLFQAEAGAAPLWVRLEPIRYDVDPRLVHRTPYVVVGIALDATRHWQPRRLEGAFRPTDLRRGAPDLPRTQRQRFRIMMRHPDGCRSILGD